MSLYYKDFLAAREGSSADIRDFDKYDNIKFEKFYPKEKKLAYKLLEKDFFGENRGLYQIALIMRKLNPVNAKVAINKYLNAKESGYSATGIVL